MSDPARAEIEIEVRYAETDQMGVVHHSNYLVWFELARTSLCSLSGYHYADIENLGYLLMVTGAELNYRRSARYGDTVTVSCWIDRLGSRGLTFGYEVVLDGQLLLPLSAHGSSPQHYRLDALPSSCGCARPHIVACPFMR